ncbi:uncharacterized protein M421DRAFT_419585 [Didymella exigua CBS 183.55]|uniref:FAR-17a/AIG1-like protein n=1 Tax=Didymella exigua CBS 183.55 TaxID=1150837 RepID=A0A6A5RQ64_9PLEO|nr:uncharacterized protein M421DRAFT_419585 [Didymella exigua CBS 183.55]KAF1929809.1 hypothetical protein M421DRAFT_419585 [Didymella exigua CBS 183.55]
MGVSDKAAELGRQHPLQRLESPSKGFSGALHVIGLISFYSSFKFLHDNPNQFNFSYGWHLQFLTIIGITISTICFTFGLLADITSSSSTAPASATSAAAFSPQTVSDYFFAAKNYLSLVAAPIEIVISILYWGLRLVDTGLVIPPDLPLPPLSTDLCFHLVPAVVLTVDAILLSPPWPSSPMNPQAPFLTLGASTGIAFAYWWWIEICYSHNGYYPYPIFELLTTYQRIGLFAVSGATMWVAGGTLRALYAYANGYELTEALEKRQRARKMGSEGKWD